jgi:maltose alpha-D-glucosyltransferase/alpha-amylase
VDPSASALDAHGGFLAMAATLGQRTAELHRALARPTGDPAFDPEPLLASDVDALRQRAGEELRTTLALLSERLALLPAATQTQAQALLSMQEMVQARIDAGGGGQAGTAVKTRYHGDYHLGQVLVDGSDFVIIDFEGEPARSFDERRAKSSALRDVAGMLRSFNYARWAALKSVAQDAEELHRLDAPAHDWEAATRAAFLSAYANALGTSEPGFALDTEMLRLFELQKALYELRYEINNRIDWLGVPLQGILDLIKGEISWKA